MDEMLIQIAIELAITAVGFLFLLQIAIMVVSLDHKDKNNKSKDDNKD